MFASCIFAFVNSRPILLVVDQIYAVGPISTPSQPYSMVVTGTIAPMNATTSSSSSTNFNIGKVIYFPFASSAKKSILCAVLNAYQIVNGSGVTQLCVACIVYR